MRFATGCCDGQPVAVRILLRFAASCDAAIRNKLRYASSWIRSLLRFAANCSSGLRPAVSVGPCHVPAHANPPLAPIPNIHRPPGCPVDKGGRRPQEGGTAVNVFEVAQGNIVWCRSGTILWMEAASAARYTTVDLSKRPLSKIQDRHQSAYSRRSAITACQRVVDER